MLRRANLTKEQNQLVLSQAPKLEKLRVQEALYVILGQDYRSAVSQDRDRKPFGRPLPRGRGYVVDDEEDYDDEVGVLW